MKTKEPTQAKRVWEFCSGKSKFTADEVASGTGVSVTTVRHYFSYWRGLDAMEQIGRVSEEVGKRGRPRAIWKTSCEDYKPVWRS